MERYLFQVFWSKIPQKKNNLPGTIYGKRITSDLIWYDSVHGGGRGGWGHFNLP